MQELENYAAAKLVREAKNLIDELDWLVRAYEKDDYAKHRAQFFADAAADVKVARKEFNKAFRAYIKVASYICVD